jgi:hypothetical protein
VKEIARTEGLLISPEGAATWKALQIKQAKDRPSENTFANTGWL